MFAIIISEKGGAERKESFDKNEINVGRVQGNDLMLPKGNVSKHHARLLYRDGRFIVTDLKSTNGTYVNGRKIAQATIVREGDKIYIGDFVLRLDGGQAPAQVEPPMNPAAEEESVRTLARANEGQQQRLPAQLGPAVTLKAPTHSPNQSAPRAQPGASTVAAGGMPRNDPSVVSHYPLERDPDESESAPAQVVAAAPAKSSVRVPTTPPVNASAGARGVTMPIQQLPSAALAHPRGPTAPSAGGAALGQSPNANARAPVPVPTAQGPRLAPRESAAQAGRRLALITLVDRIADAVDLRPLKSSPLVDDVLAQQIDRAAREQANAMRDEGEAPEGVDVEALVRDAVRELVGLGPIGPLLEEDEVSEIHCVRSDQVLAMRGGQITMAESSFTSEEALFRAIARLANQSGDPWRAGELVVERRLPRGAQMLAIAPPAASAHVLVIRKKRRIDVSLEDFARAGALSRPMAVFLEHCLTARSNVLVCGPASAGIAGMLAALASSGPAGERICALHDVEEINVPHAHMVSLPIPDTRARGEETLRAAAKLRPDRLVIGSLAVHVVAATLEAIAEGAEGVLAAMYAPSLRQGLSRMVSQLLLARPGLNLEAIREAVGEAFDVVIELGTLPDGRQRVMRIAELGGSDGKGVVVRDLYTFDPSGEGGFVATGTVPRMVADLALKGVKVDPAIFKKGR